MQIVVVLLFGRTLYVELDVDAELAKGALPGCLSLVNKLGPAMQAVVTRTVSAVTVGSTRWILAF